MGTTAARAAFALALAVQLLVLYAPDPGTGGASLPGLVDLPGLDKVVHAAVFAAAAWTGRWARLPVAPLLAGLMAHAGLSEVVQHALLPARAGDPLDALADVVGVALGAVAPVRRTGTGRRGGGPRRESRTTRGAS